jgi:hypothetical protein
LPFALAGCTALVDVSGLAGGDGTDATAPEAGDSGAPSQEAGTDGAPDAFDATPADATTTDGGSEASRCPAPRRVLTAKTATSTGGASNVSILLSDAQNAGDFVAVGVNYSPTCGAIASVTDTRGNVYRSLVPPLGRPGALVLETWGAENVAAANAGTNTVLVSFPNICASVNVKIVEYAGTATSNALIGQTSLAGAPDGGAPDGSLTTASAAVLFAHTADETSAHDAGAGWTVIFKDTWSTLALEQIVDAGGLYRVTYAPDPKENWVIEAIALRTCL